MEMSFIQYLPGRVSREQTHVCGKLGQSLQKLCPSWHRPLNDAREDGDLLVDASKVSFDFSKVLSSCISRAPGNMTRGRVLRDKRH